MLRPAFLLITLLLVCGCRNQTLWRTGTVGEASLQPARVPVVARASSTTQAKAPAAQAAPGKPPAGSGDYLYGAKFEPPRGRILHGMGNFEQGNADYLQLLDDPSIHPASFLEFKSIGESPRDWDARIQRYRLELQAEERLGRIPQLNLGLHGIDPRSHMQESVDDEIANTDHHDRRIRDMAQLLAAHVGPVFLRIGAEFSHDYHPYDYPRAFRKVVEIFRAEGADNVAFVWCYEPSAPDDFDQRDSRGAKWYPGDDVVDWFGIDLFDFAEEPVVRRPARLGADPASQSSRLTRTEHFLAMARAHGKPVMIGECSPAREDITADMADGRRDWDAWFAPFLRLLDDHPEIEAFYLVNYDWRLMSTTAELGWQRAEIQVNPYIGPKWVEELRKPRYLHLADVSLLNGYAEARASRPAYKGPGPADPLDYDPRMSRRATKP